jgi:hypothetical protein
VGNLFKKIVEIRPLEQPVKESKEFSLVQNLEAANRSL